MKFYLIFIFSLVLFSCEQKDLSRPELKTDFNKNDLNGVLKVGFLIVDGVYNSELMAPYDIFHHTIFHTDSGMKVFTVAPTKKVIRSFEGIHIIPDFDFSDTPDIDVLVVPSAEHSMNSDMDNVTLINFVRDRGNKAKFVMSLCDGAFLLAKAGLLDGLNSTTFPDDIDEYKKAFPHLKVQKGYSFIHDAKFVTSSGGALSYDSSFYLIHHIYGEKVARGVANGMALKWETYKTTYKYINFNEKNSSSDM